MEEPEPATSATEWPRTNDIEIPDEFLDRWQRLIDLAAEIIGVPAGLIMRIDPPYIEVVQSSDNPENPYTVGDREKVFGLYCEEVVRSDAPLHVPDSQLSDRWRDNLDVEEFGLRAYLGYPIEWPDGAVFGTICVLDSERREFDEGPYKDLLEQAKATVEADLELLIQREMLAKREAELNHQNELLDEFTSVVAHDLRNPLNVALGYVSLAEESPAKADLRPAINALRRMERILEGTLELARHGDASLDTTVVCIEPVVDDVWTVLDTANATLTVEADQCIEADHDRLWQLFGNLLQNAVIHGGDSVHIRVGWTDPDTLYVMDDGPGIPVDQRTSVFESGVTNSKRGTGFGLPIVRRIADAHGWTVTCTDSPSGGARFELRGITTV